MRRFFWIRLTLFLRQSRWGFGLLFLWFALGTLAFAQSVRDAKVETMLLGEKKICFSGMRALTFLPSRT
jgi:hypothetical protein